MSTNNLTLGYWNSRGMGEQIRTLMSYLELPFEVKKYYTYEEWLAFKSTAQFPFANLPYLIDGDKTITESEAIQAHLCIKANRPDLLGKNEDRVEFVQLRGVIADVNEAIVGPCYETPNLEDFKKSVEAAMESDGFKLKTLNKILEEREWLLGYLTYLDFFLAEIVERFTLMDSEIGTSVTRDYPALQAHAKRFVELPAIKAYRESDKYQARPHNGSSAAWH